MKTLTLHTISYQPRLNQFWAGISVCDFNSKSRMLGLKKCNQV